MTRPDLPFYVQQHAARRRRQRWCLAIVLPLVFVALAVCISYVRVP